MDWKNKPNQIFHKVKQQMYSKGVETFHFADQFINHFDPQHTGQLSSHFFNLLLNKIGVFLTTQQIRNIRDLYSKNKQIDLIQYRAFLEDVKYSINEKIAELVNQAFTALDPNGKESVSAERILQIYNNSQHPHAATRRKAPEDIKNEFISAIQRKADQQGNISRAAFVDYYAELNFCIPAERQGFFATLITETWNLKNSQEYVPPQRLRQIEHTLYEKIRLKSNGKTNEWKTAKKALSYFDLADEKVTNFEQFKSGLDKFGCNFKQNEAAALYSKYSESGVLNYEQFAKAIMGLDISGMSSQPNLLYSKMGKSHFTLTH